MSPTTSQVENANPQKVLDLVENWKKRFATLETRAETYKGYINKPGGSAWEGKTAEAAKGRANEDYTSVSDTRDTVDTQSLSISNTVSSSLWPPLKNAQQIIANAKNSPGVTVNDDLTMTYSAPEGTSNEAAEKNAKTVADAAAELKREADKWWAAEEQVAGQIRSLKDTVATAFNSAPLTYHLTDAFQLAPGEKIALEPGETHNVGPIAGTGAVPGIPGIGGADLGEIVTLPDGRQVAIFGDSFSGPGVQGTHYPSVAVEVKIDPQTGQMTFTKVLTGPDGSNTIFPIPENVKKDHPEAAFTLPAGSIQANGKTYMKVAATDGHLQPTGGSWLVEVNNNPEKGWTAVGDKNDGKPPSSYREWKYDHTPTADEPWKVTGKADNPPSQISGYQGSDGKVHIAANSFDRSQPVTMYQVDNPADAADPNKWKPLLANGSYGTEGQLAATPISDSKFGELSFREIDGRPVLSGLNLGPGGGVEVYVGSAGHPGEVLDNRPVSVGGFDGPARVEAPYSGFIVPNPDGTMPHLDKMPILVSQWTPGPDGVPGNADDSYNTQQVFVNATPPR